MGELKVYQKELLGSLELGSSGTPPGGGYRQPSPDTQEFARGQTNGRCKQGYHEGIEDTTTESGSIL